ncbi:MAG: hypothetical protein R6V33_08710 [Pelovirga sp.]
MSAVLKPDLMLLDLYFPEGKGTEILWNIRARPAGLSDEEVAELIGAGRTTARRYLEDLVAHNDLHTELAYGTIGRPERRYFCHNGRPEN